MERAEAGLQCLCIVIFPPDQWLPRDIILAWDFGRGKLVVVGAPTGRVN